MSAWTRHKATNTQKIYRILWIITSFEPQSTSMVRKREKLIKYVTSVNPSVSPTARRSNKFPSDRHRSRETQQPRESRVMFSIKVPPEIMKILRNMMKNDLGKIIGREKWALKYKAVDKKKHPVPNTFPESVEVWLYVTWPVSPYEWHQWSLLFVFCFIFVMGTYIINISLYGNFLFG